MKIATWNVNSLNVRLPQVAAWLAERGGYYAEEFAETLRRTFSEELGEA